MTGKIVTPSLLHEAIRALRESLSNRTCPHAIWDVFASEILGSSLLLENSTIEQHDMLQVAVTAMLGHVLPNRGVTLTIYRFRDSEFCHGPLGISDAQTGWFIFDESIGEGLLFLGMSDEQRVARFSLVRAPPRPALLN